MKAEREEQLRNTLGELRQMFLNETRNRKLSVREAQLCLVCRVCRGDNRPNGGGFLLLYGDEHAHESCVQLERQEIAS